MKFSDIKGMNTRDLARKKKELLEEIFHGQMKNAMGQLGNPLELRKNRRFLARIHTAFSLLRAQKTAQQEASQRDQSQSAQDLQDSQDSWDKEEA